MLIIFVLSDSYTTDQKGLHEHGATLLNTLQLGILFSTQKMNIFILKI